MASSWKLTKKLKDTHISTAFLRGLNSDTGGSRANTLVAGKGDEDELATPRASVSVRPNGGAHPSSGTTASQGGPPSSSAPRDTSAKPSLLRVKIYAAADLAIPERVRNALPEWAFDTTSTRPPPVYLVLDYDKTQTILHAIGGTVEHPAWDKTSAFDAAASGVPLKVEVFVRSVRPDGNDEASERERGPNLATDSGAGRSPASASVTSNGTGASVATGGTGGAGGAAGGAAGGHPTAGSVVESALIGSLQIATDQQSPTEPLTLKSSNGRRAGVLDIRFETQQVRNQPLTIEDFTLLKVVGKGSFGKVMQVRKKDTQQIYALKTIRKAHIVSRSEVGHTLAERTVLAKINNPFIVPLKFSFQSPEKLYLVLAFVNGGELFHHLQREGRFDLNRARFYTAELLCALECLHEYNVIYRDLKPENILIDYSGHIALCDFGLCKLNMNGQEKTNTFCGTPEYLAPEVLLGHGYTKAVDWWTLGVLFYEMLTGLPPFYDQNTPSMYQKILHDPLTFPPSMDKNARSLLQGLLDRDPKTRLGVNGAAEIKAHPFFRQIDWKCLLNKKYAAPFQPSVVSASDTSNFDQEFTNEVPTDSVVDATSVLTESVQQQFGGWSYTNEGQLAASGKW